jgi:hypothetical protein
MKIKIYGKEKTNWFEMDDTKLIMKFPKTNKVFCNVSESEIRVTKNGTYLFDDHVNVHSSWKKTIYQKLWRIISKNEADEIIADYNLDLEKEKTKKSIEEFPKKLEV